MESGMFEQSAYVLYDEKISKIVLRFVRKVF